MAACFDVLCHQGLSTWQSGVQGFGFVGRQCSVGFVKFGVSAAALKKSPANAKGGKSSVVVPPEKTLWKTSEKKPGPKSVVEVDDSSGDPLPMPHAPAGFVLDEKGRVILVAPPEKRVVSITDPGTGRPLECVVRRLFRSSRGQQCFLLLPLDMPMQILKIEEENEGLRELSDEELEEVLPSAAYALAKLRLHLISSGFCLTVRGGFCYTEEDVIDLNTEYGQGLGGSLAEGVEITSFQVEDGEYLIYTPFDPLMFVAYKDDVSGELQIADDELLEDDAVLDAIDEENEFQSLVEEEESINETLREAK